MKKFKDIANEEVFQHHIVQGNTESGKVAHTGTLKQMQKQLKKTTYLLLLEFYILIF